MASGVGILRGSEIQKMLRSQDGPVGRHLTIKATRVQEVARAKAGMKTGRLRKSIVKRFTPDSRGLAITIQANVPYAMYHHEGTPPHIIQGNPLLSFYWPKVGKRVAFRFVHHPGTKPNRFLLDALREIGVS